MLKYVKPNQLIELKNGARFKVSGARFTPDVKFSDDIKINFRPIVLFRDIMGIEREAYMDEVREVIS